MIINKQKGITSKTKIQHFDLKIENLNALFIYSDILELKSAPSLVYKKGHWLYNDGSWKYFKVPNVKEKPQILEELYGVQVSKYFGVDTVEYKIATGKVGDKTYYGVVSDLSLEASSNYLTFREFQEQNNAFQYKTMEDFLDSLKKEKTVEQVCTGFRAFVIRDFYAGQPDRCAPEYLVCEKNGIYKLNKIIDYEAEFTSYSRSCAYNNDDFSINFTWPSTVKRAHMVEEYQEGFQKIMKLNPLLLIHQVEMEHQVQFSLSKKVKLCQADFNRKLDIIRLGLLKRPYQK